jgi:rare lipoprotein A
MRSPDDRILRRARFALALIAVSALAGCGVLGGSHRDLASARTTPAALAAANGPAADYPVVVGDPYRVGATLFTPADTMNYDEVGYAAVDRGAGVTGSHHTLPLPSYVEVTSLETGKTVLVRIERRGPMDGDAVVALSPAAFAQLDASAGDPVRVRRVNPPEEERAALRNGRAAPARMDTPASLVAVLKRKLPGEGSAPLTPKAPAPAALASVELPASSALQRALPQPVASAAPAAAAANRAATRSAPPPLPPLPVRNREAAAASSPAFTLGTRQDVPQQRAIGPAVAVAVEKPVSADGAFIVQAAAMSTAERAKKVAGTIGGSVSKSGDYFRVRTGPFATRAEAEASLAKVRAAGYSDARIFTNG